MTKKNFKSVLALFLAAATLFAITGCSAGTGDVTGDTGDTITAAVDTDAAAVTDHDGTAVAGDDTGKAGFDLSGIDVGDEILIPELLPVGEITPAADTEILLMADGDTPLTTVATTINTTAANDKPWISGWGNTNGNDTDDDNSNTDGHVPGTPRDSKAMKSIPQAYGTTITLVKSISNPTEPDTKDTSNDTTYGKVDWSTAAQGYISFTAKGQERMFIIQGPNDKQAMFTVQKNETIKVSLIDGTGKYQYAIANNSANGTTYTIQYKNSFSISKIDSDLAPYLVSNPYGDYNNAPTAVAKADELWNTNKTQLENIKAITKYVTSTLKYDTNLRAGSTDVYVNPDKVIENGGGVCNDMAKTLVAMLRSQGIPAYYQGGKTAKGQSHAWVMAWVELSTSTKNGTTYSTGAWILIESTGGGLQPQSTIARNYISGNTAN